MDELSEEDKLTVARARKIQRFLSQPFQVAEVFTGHAGKLVTMEQTISGFTEILSGKYDHLPEVAFYMVGDISEVCIHSVGHVVFDGDLPAFSSLRSLPRLSDWLPRRLTKSQQLPPLLCIYSIFCHILFNIILESLLEAHVNDIYYYWSVFSRG